MLITRETDYALRILRTLSEGESFTAGDLVEKESLPQSFAYKILKKLEKAGIIQITRGSTGGCSLKADLSTISLYQLIEAVEVNSYLTACMKPEYNCEWREKSGTTCNVHNQLDEVQKNIDKELKSHSLHWVLFGHKDE